LGKDTLKVNGFVYLKNDNVGALEKKWITIFGKELYMYHSPQELGHYKLHSLVGAFIYLEPTL
jgi:hypothetical protein